MSAARKKAAGTRQRPQAAHNSTTRRSLAPNGAEAQRKRVLARLRQGPASTIQLRRDIDVLMPAARVHELRHRFGYDIPLTWVEDQTECGRKHRVGLYTLRPGSSGDGAATHLARSPKNAPGVTVEAVA